MNSNDWKTEERQIFRNDDDENSENLVTDNKTEVSMDT